MRGCAGTLFTVEKILARAGIEFWTARSVGQCLSHGAIGAPVCYHSNYGLTNWCI